MQKFAHRVAVTTNELFDAVNILENPNFAAVAGNSDWAAVVQNRIMQQVLTLFVRQTLQTLHNALDKTIFLKGQINALVKNLAPKMMMEALETAVKIKCNQCGPIDHTIALEKSNAKPSAQAINFVKRGGFHGQGQSTSR